MESGSFFQRTVTFFHKFFPKNHNWKNFTPKTESASKCVTRVQKDVKDSIGDFHCKKQQNCDVDMGVQVCQDVRFNKETITHLYPPSKVAISQEHITEAGNEVLCERSPVTPGFPSLDMSSIVRNGVDSSRRMTRSMKKMDDGFCVVNVNVNVNDISNLNKGGTPENLRKVVESKLSVGCKERSGKIASCDKDRKGISSEGKNKKRSQKEAEIINNIKSKMVLKRKLITSPKSARSVKRKLITTPKSARSTFSTGNKGCEERYESANILSLESFSGKKSRSGRILLPPLEFWRNQRIVYDEDGQMCGVQEGKNLSE